MHLLLSFFYLFPMSSSSYVSLILIGYLVVAFTLLSFIVFLGDDCVSFDHHLLRHLIFQLILSTLFSLDHLLA